MTIKKEKKTDKYVNPNNVNCAYFILLNEFETLKKISHDGKKYKTKKEREAFYYEESNKLLKKYFNPVMPYWANAFATFMEIQHLRIPPNDTYLRVNRDTQEVWLRINKHTTQEDVLVMWDEIENAKHNLKSEWIYPKISERDLEIYLKKEYGGENYEKIISDDKFIAKYDYIDEIIAAKAKHRIKQKLKNIPK